MIAYVLHSADAMATQLISLLLLMAGDIEENPGPGDGEGWEEGDGEGVGGGGDGEGVGGGGDGEGVGGGGDGEGVGGGDGEGVGEEMVRCGRRGRW